MVQPWVATFPARSNSYSVTIADHCYGKLYTWLRERNDQKFSSHRDSILPIHNIAHSIYRNVIH